MSITIQSLLTTWGNAFKSGDPTEISKILDENFKHINLHQAEKGFETLQDVAIGFGVHDVDENVREKTSGRRRYGF